MATADTIILGVISSGVFVTAVSSVLNARSERRRTRWELQREACAAALKVIDGAFANTEFVTDGVVGKNLHQDAPSIEAIRQSHNDLLVTCANADIAVAYRRCLGLDPAGLSASAIDDLRIAIRKELGFGHAPGTDRSMSWIAYSTQSKEAIRESAQK